MKIQVIEKTIFLPSPGPGVGVMGGSFYSTNDDRHLVAVSSHTSRSDTVEVAYVQFSDDNGRTWSAPFEWPMKFSHPNGTGRRHPRGGYCDPQTGRFIFIWTEGVLPTDDPLEGLQHWKLHYRVSEDGGRTYRVDEQIIHEGDEFDVVHHFPGITVGKNCLMLGDLGQRPITREGTILVPVQTSPVGPDGEYFNPGAGYTYSDCMLLFGRWQPDGRLAWTCSERIVGDPTRSTRGMVEPTIAELADGSILMIMRGSNDVRPEWPGYRWQARSNDGGHTWSRPEPWTYDDGTPFFSPSSCSQLLRHSCGHLLWIGNISPENPKGNRPRYPLVLGEVDQSTGLLQRETVQVIDTCQPGDSEWLTLSNFYVREDRQTGELLLHLPRFFARCTDLHSPDIFTTDLFLYRIAVK